MSELAFNVNGEPFEVPVDATGWRVRRLKQKGAPEVVYGRDGIPLVLSVDAELDDLRREVGTPGRYRLDPVDGASRPIANAQAAYVFVHADARPIETTVAKTEPTDNMMVEAMRLNAEMARAIIDRFPQMLESAAQLLRAADGAGLPARPGTVVEEVEEELVLPPQGFDLNALVAQIVPMLLTSLASGKAKLPPIDSVLDWRKAVPRTKRTQTIEIDEVEAPSEPMNSPLPAIDPQSMSHFIAIQSALEPAEGALAREVAATLSPAELRSWFDELTALSVPDAVTKIRALLAKKGGAS